MRLPVRATLMLLIAALVAASSPLCAQDRPPRPLDAPDLKIPPYEIRTLQNGLRVVVVAQHEQPAVSLRLIVKAGAAQDPMNKPGLAGMVGALLDQGTAKRSSEEISDAIDYIGGALGTGAATDLSFVNILILKDSFDFGLDLMSEVVRTPSFPQDELDRVRDQALSAMSVNMQDPDFVADAVIGRLVYGFHPYGLPRNGTPESLPEITRDDLVTFHSTWFAPNNAILAVVGDVDVEAAFAAVTQVFGSWQPHDVPAALDAELPEPTRRVVLVDRPNAVQTEIRAGHVAIARKHPDFMTLNLATKILGGEGANRLQNVLRSEKGLTYGASADMDAFKLAGSIIVPAARARACWRAGADGRPGLSLRQLPAQHRDGRRHRAAGAQPPVLRPRREGSGDVSRSRERRHERRHPARGATVRQAEPAVDRAGRRRIARAAAARGGGRGQRRGAAAFGTRPDQSVAAPQGTPAVAGARPLRRACRA